MARLPWTPWREAVQLREDLADRVGELARAAVGHDLKFRVRVELGGDQPPPDDVVATVNEALAEVSPDLRLRQ